ncbi:UNVERIFIED_CONTAM: hypothetical protein Slati_0126500 [Sesamum latifolium]|uniref:Uncharacterized protein n=1 Tax=Sesamum latifolium TaxID=2727402 RepID=A0AAW2Y9J2_9LAMI
MVRSMVRVLGQKFDGVVIEGTLFDAASGMDADGGGGGGAADEDTAGDGDGDGAICIFPIQHEKGVE